jgi:hypothetical protein
MFASAAPKLFVPIAVTVPRRDRLAGRGIGGTVLSKTAAQFIGGAAGLAAAVGYLVAAG